MIKEDVFPIGTISRLHGNKGELLCMLANTNFDEDKLEYLIVELDSILVPFYISSFRFRSDTSLLVEIENCQTEQYAKRLIGKKIFLPISLRVDSDIMLYSELVGYEVMDEHLGRLGEIIEVDDSTVNRLLFLTGEKVIPFHEDLLRDIDTSKRKIYMSLPQGLFDDAEAIN